MSDLFKNPHCWFSQETAHLFQKVKESELGDAVLVDADKNTVSTEYDDLNDLPDEIVSVSDQKRQLCRLRSCWFSLAD